MKTAGKHRETERLSIRCTKREKRMIREAAEAAGETQTSYTLNLYRQAHREQRRDGSSASAVCRMQDLVNYPREHHIEDEYVLEECDRIWDELN